MANPCAGLDPTWAHLPAPAHCHSWLFPAAAFENEALTSALRASMTPTTTNTKANSASYPTTPSSSSTSSASDLLSSGHDAPASRPATVPPALTGPRAGRVAKRKPRPSRRPPVTYITADPANFRRMVQEVTGFPAAAASGVRMQAAASEPASPSWHAPTACALLPTLDTSAFLLDRPALPAAAPARGQEGSTRSSSGDASRTMAVTAAVEDDESSVLMKELEAMACAPAFVSADDFPTLESWGII